MNPTLSSSLALLGALTALLLWGSAVASPLTTGAVCSWGASDCTRCVPDAVNATPVLLPPRRMGNTAAAGTASLARLSDGTFLLIFGQTDANNLEFSRSNSGDLTRSTTSFEPVDLWNEGELRSTIGDWEFGNYQNLNLITQCDGSLFLAGTHRNSYTGQDWIDLYRLTDEYGQMVITKVAKKHLDYRDVSLERYGDLRYVEGFGDKTSAVRWCLPYGWRFRIHEHDSYGGSYKELNGSGSLNLNSVGFGDKTSSARFVYLGY